MRWLSALTICFLSLPTLHAADDPVVASKGKHIVLISGDEEYRSEEMLPQLAKILSKFHGFKTTTLFAIDKKDGTINPNQGDNIPGLEALKDADLLILFTRFRNLPDEQMKHFVDYIESGKPILGIRTATHAFNLSSPTYKKYTWTSKEKGYEGGFGRQVLGETWISHHGNHGKEATRGIFAEDAKNHPILKGIKDGEIFGPTDVYGVRLPLPGDSKPLVYGQVVVGMDPKDPPVTGKKNEPMMPIVWTKTYQTESGKTGRILTSTMGCSQDFLNVGFRRLMVNGAYWCLGLEAKTPEESKVDIIGTFEPIKFGNNIFKKGVTPEDALK
jgi:type 1 glutamine amidotransferase